MLLEMLVVRLGRSVSRRIVSEWDTKLVATLPGPGRVFFALLLFHLSTPLLGLPAPAQSAIGLLVRVLLIVAATWFVLRLITLGAAFLEAYLSRRSNDPSQLRAIHTQTTVPRDILRFVIIVVGVALVLLQFEAVRAIGVSLLASAGVAGLVIGLAAQRTISNLLAGIQIILFKPIKIGDAVVVENEWGWVEEIGLTHVVIKVWDLRRLVLPVSYFLEKPFQNWTRKSANLLGTVLLHTDYTVPVDAVRSELGGILAQTPLWDGQVQAVQVTNLTPQTVEVRVLVSATGGGELWDLRCLVREKLLGWLQSRGAGHLPLQRVELLPQHNGESCQGKASSVISEQ
jgi:small-conductance mechanosensitive channel